MEQRCAMLIRGCTHRFDVRYPRICVNSIQDFAAANYANVVATLFVLGGRSLIEFTAWLDIFWRRGDPGIASWDAPATRNCEYDCLKPRTSLRNSLQVECSTITLIGINPLEPRTTWVQHQLCTSAASKSMELFQPYSYSTIVQFNSFLLRLNKVS